MLEKLHDQLMPRDKYPGVKAKVIESDSLPYWVEMIRDLVDGAGYSYSRIAYRIKVSASTIQKLATRYDRKPRHRIFHALLQLHYKIFQGPYATEKALEYWRKKTDALD